MGGGGEEGEKGGRGGSGKLVGNRGRGKREGGGRFFPNVLKHTDTRTPSCSPGCSHGKIPEQPQKAALFRKEEGHMVGAANGLRGI